MGNIPSVWCISMPVIMMAKGALCSIFVQRDAWADSIYFLFIKLRIVSLQSLIIYFNNNINSPSSKATLGYKRFLFF